MRPLDDARGSWEEVKQYQTLRQLKDAVRLDGDHSIATSGGRSTCWKAFLLFDSADTSTWPRILSSSRSAYNALRAHFLKHLENPDEVTAGYDPLSVDNEISPWAQLRKDEELRGEILQDVVRCMPENLYFRQPDTQRILLDILFIFCKLNPDVSYRQGMHELLAPILWVVERDAIDLGRSSKIMGEDAIIATVFDAEHIEHDTFALFGQVMQNAKNFYEQTTTSGKENPMVARSKRIFNDMLSQVDARLSKHLESIDILPQIFLMRWIRLLFGREFSFDGLLTLWDVIFAEDPALEIVDHICVVMLLRIRWQLIEADYNAALTILLRYPDADETFQPQTLALDALYLRNHMDSHGGSYIVSKYTGHPLQEAGRPVTPPALQRNITTFSGQNSARRNSKSRSPTPSAASRQTRNIEAVLQSTAKNIYARGEKLGIAKVVRNAVDEVHKKAQEIRDAQTPSPPVTWRSRGYYGSSIGPDALQNRVKSLENRSRQLSKLLEGALGELWEYQRTATEDPHNDEQPNEKADSVEKLSVAIAKVQFVQVYLDDPGLPLPEEPEQDLKADEVDIVRSSTADDTPAIAISEQESDTAGTTSNAVTPPPGTVDAQESGQPSKQKSTAPAEGLADPSTFEEDFTDLSTPDKDSSVAKLNTSSDHSKVTVTSPSPPQETQMPPQQSSRPRLEQSSLSWMLGQQDGQDDDGGGNSMSKSSSRPFGNVSPFPPDRERERARSKGFLFGDDGEGSNSSATERRTSGKWNQRKKPGESSTDGNNDVEDEGFDLGSLRHAARRH